VSFASCFVALNVNFIDRTDTRFARTPRYFRTNPRRLVGFQVLNQVRLFVLGQPQFEDTIVVVNDVEHGRESAVMVEASFMWIF